MKQGQDAADATQLSLLDALEQKCEAIHQRTLVAVRAGEKAESDALAQDYLKAVETRNEWADALTKPVRLSGDH